MKIDNNQACCSFVACHALQGFITHLGEQIRPSEETQKPNSVWRDCSMELPLQSSKDTELQNVMWQTHPMWCSQQCRPDERISHKQGKGRGDEQIVLFPIYNNHNALLPTPPIEFDTIYNLTTPIKQNKKNLTSSSAELVCFKVMLPVPRSPDVEKWTPVLFTAIMTATNPYKRVNFSVNISLSSTGFFCFYKHSLVSPIVAKSRQIRWNSPEGIETFASYSISIHHSEEGWEGIKRAEEEISKTATLFVCWFVKLTRNRNLLFFDAH